MRRALFLLPVLFLSFGCARVSVVAPKEPIKMDISMRLDIYQHVEKDINQIENIVSGKEEKPKPTKDIKGMLNHFVRSAYAEEPLDPEVEQAALRRKERRDKLLALEAKGVVGENKYGLVEIRIPGRADSSVQALVGVENADRMVISDNVARKNGTTSESVGKVYAIRLQADAPSGTPIEVASSSGDTYVWKIK